MATAPGRGRRDAPRPLSPSEPAEGLDRLLGEGRVEGTVPLVFSADETCDVGSDTASPVSDDYTSAGSRFTGTVEWVQIDLAEAAEDLDHLISPEERLHIAMARQ